MELIERETIAQNAQTYSIEYGEYIGEDVRELEMVLLSRVMSAPIIDAVPVVRCKECKNYVDGVCWLIRRIMAGYYRGGCEVKTPSDFCSQAVRKKEAAPKEMKQENDQLNRT